ncbi:LysR substrate-binding domain-containing protein [Peribacillus frigoritolerans]|nr:LysR substrate-binding domain-containing protein [Peribacillus frigoritolerans]
MVHLTGTTFIKIFEVSNVEPRIEFQVDHLEVAKSLILSRSCIGFLPYLCIKKELEQGTLIEVDVSHLIKIKQHIYLTHLNHGMESPLLWKDILLSIRKFEKKPSAITETIELIDIFYQYNIFFY